MPVYKETGSAINFDKVTNCWVSDGEIHFYFIGGTDAEYLEPMASKMWKDYQLFLRRIDGKTKI